MDRAEKISKLLNKGVSIDSSVEIAKIKPKSKDLPYQCVTCGKIYKRQYGNFSKNASSPLFASNDYYLPTCKHCVEELYKQYVDLFNGNDERAIERICQIYDYYFTDSALMGSLKISDGQSRINGYIRIINLEQYNGKTYVNTIKDGANENIQSIAEVSDMEIDEIDEKALKDAIIVWGLGFSPEQYSILNDSFADWKSRVVIDSKTREALVRELCIIKLQMNNALKDNDVDLYQKLVKTYQDTMKSANLQPLQEDITDKASEKPIGVMIKMFEDERPIPKPLKEWEDVDGIVKYITIYFLGHLCKMLKIKNRYAALYEAEMAKYRVEIPEMEEADDEDIFEALINGEADFDSGEKG